MNHYLVLVYGICFSLIGGAAFAMMWANINSLDIQPRSRKQRHPEAPEPGEEVMYVDLSREKLEGLYKKDE